VKALKLFSWLARFLTFFILLVLALNNQQVVSIHGLGQASWSVSMSWLLLGTLAIGIGIGAVAMTPTLLRQRRALRSAQRGAVPAPASSSADDELGI
jgi:uncharacterized integral membrane protein